MIRLLTAALFLLACVPAEAQDAPSASAAAGASSPAAPASQTPPKPFVYAPKQSDIVTGKDGAPVTIVEYASLSCPHCSHFYGEVLPIITAKYIDTGRVRLVYRDYPLNDAALKAAELVQCAPPDEQHAFIKVLFTTQRKWAYDPNYRDALANIAVLGGMGRMQFESCMSDKSVERAVLNVAKEAADNYKVSSTPTFYINGTEFKGDRDVPHMNSAIDAALAKAKQK